MSCQWSGWAKTERQHEMTREGWQPGADFATWDEAIVHATWLARDTGRPMRVVYDREWPDPWEVRTC